MNPYQHLVAEYARFAREGKAYPLACFADLPRPTIEPGAPKVLLFSPHPDDEVIIGALPLRLLREARMNVINVAVTLGSNKPRRAERWSELEACCRCIGFGLIAAASDGLQRIQPATRDSDPGHWNGCVRVIAEILARERPAIVFFPHAADWNSTHEGTHLLLMDALRSQSKDFECAMVETEFWGAMDDPNLMVESSPQEVADLITALTFHVGEVKRNPYHLIVPAWMQDNVRRGCELVGGQGQGAPDFVFATLYRLRRWRHGAAKMCYEGGKYLPSATPADSLFD